VLTETFIEAHARHLPPPLFRLDCDPFPTHEENGRPLTSLGHASVHRAIGRLLGLDARRADRAFAHRLPLRLREASLTRFFRRRQIEVVLAEYGPTGVSVEGACATAGIPLVVHFHGYDAYHQPTLQRYLPEYLRLFDCACSVVAVSRHMRQRLVDMGAPPEKVVYNPYGIDVDAFSPTRPAEQPGVYLAVGRFVEKKAPDLTIRAFAELAATRADVRLVMIGDGPLQRPCEALANELNVGDRVDFLGPRPHTEVAREMALARCFVQHSVTAESGDMEGTPLAILEAMAAGLPVVSTRHGGILDVVSDGTTGLLVAEGDVHGMATAMDRLFVSPQLAAKMGEAGRRVIVAKYSMERSIAELAAILERAAKTRRRFDGTATDG
jgi:glycosyltransferase involved in cell wall biosynthesis